MGISHLSGCGCGPDDPAPEEAEVTLTAPFQAGQVARIVSRMAYPVSSLDAQAVTGLLAVIVDGGAAGAEALAVFQGEVESAAYDFTTPMIFLGPDGMPVSQLPPSGNYVPLGFSELGRKFFFEPQERHLR